VKATRIDPDHFLEVIANENKNSARGQLKIFFGACAGVGKTYAMLQAARQRLDDGVAVLVGEVQTHDREATRRLLEGLPELPRRTVQYHGLTLREFDLDGALAAGPSLILIDELAHANAPGSRHAKRWQDVEELLAAGVDVYTTLNVQHLESLNDIVGGIIGIRVRETVPDQCFDRAADVVLVDLPPDDLLARLHAGKVYLPEAAEQARRNFFRKGNLIALRELALRRVADRVNIDVRSYRDWKSVHTVWATKERLMICVKAEPSHEKLIREGARLAQHLQADWIVVHVDRPRGAGTQGTREALLRLTKLAESLGAEFANIPGEDVAQTLLEYVRARNATKLMLGREGRQLRWPWHRALADRIADANPDLGLILLNADHRVPRARAPSAARSPAGTGTGAGLRPHLRSLVLATLACAFTTFIASLLLMFFDSSNVVMLFMFTVVLLALRLGRAAGAWGAVLSVASFDFFFVEPRFSFAVSDTQYLFTFVLVLAVALVTGELAARLRFKARMATEGERRATAVARVARELSGAIETEQIAAVCTGTIARLFAARIALVVPDLDEHLTCVDQAEFVDASVAQWAYDHAQPAGNGTQALPAAGAVYLPLKAPMRMRGVLVMCMDQGSFSTDPDERRLLDACCSLIALALERTHFVEIAQDTLVRMEGERLRNALLAAVSHDLRTPLTAIHGLAETLELNDLPAAEQTSVSRAIRLQTESLHQLVTNLLDLARMQSEGVRLNLEWHALDEIIGSALRRLSGVLAGHVVRTRLAADLPLVELDAVGFERVLVNVLDNVAKYTPAGSTVQIHARASPDTMHVFVEDDGPGLPSIDADRLFEAFTRGTKESSITGVGLGLALCRTIVEAHAGTIRVERCVPHGTRFEIRLPLGTPPHIEYEILL
jgi:two-component system, OmpR family, sensor histidine kinase KdpD